MNKKEQFFRAQAEKILKEKHKFNYVVKEILKIQDLGIDYATFATALEFITHFEGMILPELDKPIHITRVQKTALKKLFLLRSKEGLKD